MSEKEANEVFNEYKKILEQHTQTQKRDMLLEKYSQSPDDHNKKQETVKLASSLDELLDYITVITEEWKKGGGGTAEEDVLQEIKSIENNEDLDREGRNESVRELELPIAKQLEQMADEIPQERIEEVLKIINDDNIKVWDNELAMELIEKIRDKLSKKI